MECESVVTYLFLERCDGPLHIDVKDLDVSFNSVIHSLCPCDDEAELRGVHINHKILGFCEDNCCLLVECKDTQIGAIIKDALDVAMTGALVVHQIIETHSW